MTAEQLEEITKYQATLAGVKLPAGRGSGQFAIGSARADSGTGGGTIICTISVSVPAMCGLVRLTCLCPAAAHV